MDARFGACGPPCSLRVHISSTEPTGKLATGQLTFTFAGNKCGRYSEQCLRKLAKPCMGAKGTQAARVAHTRFFGPKPRHPAPGFRGPLLAGPWPARSLPRGIGRHGLDWLADVVEPMPERFESPDSSTRTRALEAVVEGLAAERPDWEANEGWFTGFEGLDEA